MTTNDFEYLLKDENYLPLYFYKVIRFKCCGVVYRLLRLESVCLLLLFIENNFIYLPGMEGKNKGIRLHGRDSYTGV
jgi:hypothetical protein